MLIDTMRHLNPIPKYLYSKMKIYRNNDLSFDVVNDNGVLFHLHNGCVKVIGRVSSNWKHHRKESNRFPSRYSRYRDLIVAAIINEKM